MMRGNIQNIIKNIFVLFIRYSNRGNILIKNFSWCFLIIGIFLIALSNSLIGINTISKIFSIIGFEVFINNKEIMINAKIKTIYSTS